MAKPLNEQAVFIGIKGTALALDRTTGKEIWRTELKGGDFVNLVLDGGDLLATTHGEIFLPRSSHGAIRWNNPLKGLGWGLVAIASSGASSAVGDGGISTTGGSSGIGGHFGIGSIKICLDLSGLRG